MTAQSSSPAYFDVGIATASIIPLPYSLTHLLVFCNQSTLIIHHSLNINRNENGVIVSAAVTATFIRVFINRTPVGKETETEICNTKQGRHLVGVHLGRKTRRLVKVCEC
jgi:hypothetical protein